MNELMELINALAPAAIAPPVVIAAASILDATLPRPARRSRWAPARAWLSTLAVNVRHARNAANAPATPKRKPRRRRPSPPAQPPEYQP